MDFLRRVFKSDSKENLSQDKGKSNDDGLFGGLDIVETDANLPTEDDIQDNSSPKPYVYSQGPNASFARQKTHLTIYSIKSESSAFGFINGKPEAPKETHTGSQSPSAFSFINSNSTPVVETPNPSKDVPSSPKASENTNTKPTAQTENREASKPGNDKIANSNVAAPKKRPKKRTLENRPGYGVNESMQSMSSESDQAQAEKETLEQSEPNAISPPSHATVNSPTYTSKSIDLPDSVPVESNQERQEVNTNDKQTDAPSAPSTDESPPPPPADDTQIPKSSQFLEQSDASVQEYRSKCEELSSKISTLNSQTIDHYMEMSSVYSQIVESEKSIHELNAEVKLASDEEKYEVAEALKTDIEALKRQRDALQLRLQTLNQAHSEFEVLKLKYMAQNVQLQKEAYATLHQLQNSQEGIIRSIQERIQTVETEANTAYSSKVELLEERLNDVNAELERILDREQKVESKIATSTQSLETSLQQDLETEADLERTIADLRSQLSRMESSLATTQNRIKATKSKIEQKTKEHTSYLNEISSEKAAKLELKAHLNSEKRHADEKLASNHEHIRSLQENLESEKSKLTTISSSVQSCTIEIETSDLSNQEITKICLHQDSNLPQSSDMDSLRTSLANLNANLSAMSQQLNNLNSSAANLQTEITEAQQIIPLLEQSKQVAVASKEYKEAGRLKNEISSIQTSIDTKSSEARAAKQQISEIQENILTVRKEIEVVQESIFTLESKDAQAQMDRIVESRYLLKMEARKAKANQSKFGPQSDIHKSLWDVTLSEIDGLLLQLEGEQTLLAQRYNVNIPSDKELEPEVEVEEIVEAEAINVSISDQDPIVEDPDVPRIEQDGMFAGLETDEADPEISSLPEEDQIQPSTASPEVSSPTPPHSTPPQTEDPSNESNQQQRQELESSIAQLEEERQQAEAAEDYENAESIHQKIVGLQQSLEHLS